MVADEQQEVPLMGEPSVAVLDQEAQPAMPPEEAIEGEVTKEEEQAVPASPDINQA